MGAGFIFLIACKFDGNELIYIYLKKACFIKTQIDCFKENQCLKMYDRRISISIRGFNSQIKSELT